MMKIDKMKGWLFGLLVFFAFFPPIAGYADTLDYRQWRNPLPQGDVLRSIAYNGTLFVAVGGNVAVVTSRDGLSWQQKKSGISNVLYGVAAKENLLWPSGTTALS